MHTKKTMLFGLIYFITIIVSASADCDACLQGVCHSKVVFWSNFNGTSSQITVDATTNTLYLQYRDSSNEYVNIGYGLDDGKIEVIPDVPFSTTRAVDPITGRVFIGTTRGLYEYNRLTKKSRYLGLPDETIYNAMHFVKQLYYSRLPFGLCTVNNDYYWDSYDVLTWIAVDDFVVDKNDDIYYRNSARISRLANNSNTPEFLFTHRFAKLGVDNNGDVYSIVFREVEKLNYETDKFEYIGSLTGQVNEFTFDKNNNLVFHDISDGTKKLCKLVPNEGKC